MTGAEHDYGPTPPDEVDDVAAQVEDSGLNDGDEGEESAQTEHSDASDAEDEA